MPLKEWQCELKRVVRAGVDRVYFEGGENVLDLLVGHRIDGENALNLLGMQQIKGQNMVKYWGVSGTVIRSWLSFWKRTD